MQNQLLKDDDCACFLVEAIAQKSQNIKWVTTVDKDKVSHRRIRRVSLDQFYAMVTGRENAFYRMCMTLPEVIEKVVNNGEGIEAPSDTVIDELKQLALEIGGETDGIAMALAVYMLGFRTYTGFNEIYKVETAQTDALKERLYSYKRKINGD